MLGRLCPDVLLAVLRFLDIKSLVWVGHCSRGLRQRLDPRTARRFWNGVRQTSFPNGLFTVWAGSCLPVARRVYVVYGLPRIKGHHRPLIGAYLEALLRVCETGDLAHAQWLSVIFKRHYADSHMPKHPTNLVKPLFRACELGHLEFAQWYADDCGITPRHLRLHWDDMIGGEWAVDLLSTVCDNGRLDILEWFVKRFEISSLSLHTLWAALQQRPSFSEQTPLAVWLRSWVIER